VINEAKKSLKEWDFMQQLSYTSQSIDFVQSQAPILIPLNQHGMNSPEISSTMIPGIPNVNLETNDLTTQNLPNENIGITLAQKIGLKYRYLLILKYFNGTSCPVQDRYSKGFSFYNLKHGILIFFQIIERKLWNLSQRN
jgi:hypothetical protein